MTDNEPLKKKKTTNEAYCPIEKHSMDYQTHDSLPKEKDRFTEKQLETLKKIIREECRKILQEKVHPDSNKETIKKQKGGVKPKH